MGKSYLTSDYAPAVPTSTNAGGYIVVGDFSQFLFVRRVGMNLEYIPHLFSTNAGRPTGQRGFFAYARHGCDVSTTNAFRALLNKTS
jgi:HK97 family phage major capsid protein